MNDPIRITNTIWLPQAELDISFIRSPGPGGQNVNKVATAAQLRFDLMGSPSLPAGLKQRAGKLAGSRLTNTGEIVFTASKFRTQTQNREDALSRLVDLLQQAANPPKRRIPTKPTLASKRRRLDAKGKRSHIKRTRSTRPEID